MTARGANVNATKRTIQTLYFALQKDHAPPRFIVNNIRGNRMYPETLNAASKRYVSNGFLAGVVLLLRTCGISTLP